MADQLSPCLLFTGSVDKDGYGRVSFGKAVTSAHRRAYCQANGLGLSDIYRKVVRHRCDNRLCINVEHLVLGTQGQNMQDMIDRGRSLKGEANPQSKLTLEQVEYIKRHYIPADKEFSATALARRFGVSIAMISAITTGKNW